jgi:hypothetical protein
VSKPAATRDLVKEVQVKQQQQGKTKASQL